uniref:Uncharacterized protein n=1 Tax=Coccidioides posadasii RMSCC 3488 TaxID=454284 RepID=A0A0J6FAY4_COCPO|nr:hypothetical protein CPAG_02758 [Coccidioides posadasii RMSCC 3488]
MDVSALALERVVKVGKLPVRLGQNEKIPGPGSLFPARKRLPFHQRVCPLSIAAQAHEPPSERVSGEATNQLCRWSKSKLTSLTMHEADNMPAPEASDLFATR